MATKSESAKSVQAKSATAAAKFPRLIIMGPQGSGKGTQASLLAAKFKVAHIDTGNLIREEMKRDTPEGARIREVYATGQLVPFEITIGLLKKRFAQPDIVSSGGFILEGFPRNEVQYQALKELPPIDKVLYISATEKQILERLGGRLTCKNCGAIYHITNIKPKKPGVCDKDGGPLYQREDDKPEALKKRLEIFERETKPLADKFKKAGILVEVKSADSPDVTTTRIVKALGLKE